MFLRMANPVKRNIVVCIASLGNYIGIVVIKASLCIPAFLVYFPRTKARGGITAPPALIASITVTDTLLVVLGVKIVCSGS
jgi:hypothetical protein